RRALASPGERRSHVRRFLGGVEREGARGRIPFRWYPHVAGVLLVASTAPVVLPLTPAEDQRFSTVGTLGGGRLGALGFPTVDHCLIHALSCISPCCESLAERSAGARLVIDGKLDDDI